ncbi:SUMF1/EgtB/PvdO family nonheme iron enzyme [Bradyrhizobium sp. 1050_B9_N1_2]|uniref:SUMF1/EgtB/PvdO family nonheme iron enzyme n=1 Tax=Bradyrhizobium sp. 1050_B9_N1_2 TaxID=3238688 RepID=UPI003EDCA365
MGDPQRPARDDDAEIPAGRPDLPVVHVSYLEAHAFARCSGKRLPNQSAKIRDGRQLEPKPRPTESWDAADVWRGLRVDAQPVLAFTCASARLASKIKRFCGTALA